MKTRLKNSATIKPGTPRSINHYEDGLYGECTANLIKLKDLDKGILINPNLAELRFSKDKERGLFYLKDGDILIPRKLDCAPIVIKDLKVPTLASNDFYILRLNIQDKLKPEYFAWWFARNACKEKLGKLRARTFIGEKTVDLETLKELEILVPPLKEQKKALKIEDKANSLEKHLLKMISLHKELRESVAVNMDKYGAINRKNDTDELEP